MANLVETSDFFQALAQRLVDLFALKPPPQISRDRVNESLLFRHQEGFVLRIEDPQLAAGTSVDVNCRFQLVRKALVVIPGSEAPAIEFDHGGSNFRKLHRGYQ